MSESELQPSIRHCIVVGVDGSGSSIDALHWAAAIAADTGAELDAVICWHYPVHNGMTPAPVGWDPAIDAAHVLNHSLATAFGDKVPDGLRASVREGHPAQVLIQASAEDDMLVVGSRGHGGFVGLLIGSVSMYCAEHAHCPVVIARHRPLERSVSDL